MPEILSEYDSSTDDGERNPTPIDFGMSSVERYLDRQKKDELSKIVTVLSNAIDSFRKNKLSVE